MSCTDCFQNCGDSYTTDQCVKYTGEDIPLLGICQGDQLSAVEKSITDALLSALDGTGISVNDVTLDNCQWLKDKFIGKDKTLINILQLLIDGECSLKELIAETTGGSVSFNTECLTGLGSNPTPNQILAAALNVLCPMKETVDSLPTTYVKISDLNTLIQQYIASNPTIVVPENCPIPYVGSLSFFDNTGKGISGSFVGWAIMNGQNGTQDWRGRKVVGAVKNVPGSTLDAAVDPAIVGPMVNYGVGDKFGEAFHKLITSEIPSHTHGITDPGHNHPLSQYKNDTSGGDQPNTLYVGNDHSAVPYGYTTSNATTNISIAAAGGNLTHENRDPSVSAIWIVKLP